MIFYENQVSKYIDEESIKSDLLCALKCKIGSFHPNLSFGCNYDDEDDSQTIIANIRRAVKSIQGVFVKSIAKSNGGHTITYLINNKEREVHIN